jgi:hypothetical protein
MPRYGILKKAAYQYWRPPADDFSRTKVRIDGMPLIRRISDPRARRVSVPGRTKHARFRRGYSAKLA